MRWKTGKTLVHILGYLVVSAIVSAIGIPACHSFRATIHVETTHYGATSKCADDT